MLGGCHKPDGKPAPLAPAHVTFTSVEFPEGSPQLSAIRVTEAKPFLQGEESFTGQLVWNEDRTNRVFSPVAGRIETVVAEIGQILGKGDDLALMRSPDYGQAQADYFKPETIRRRRKRPLRE